MSDREEDTLEDLEGDIAEAIELNNVYSHNVCSCALRVVAEKYGIHTANDLVRNYDLTRLYGIKPVELN